MATPTSPLTPVGILLTYRATKGKEIGISQRIISFFRLQSVCSNGPFPPRENWLSVPIPRGEMN